MTSKAKKEVFCCIITFFIRRFLLSLIISVLNDDNDGINKLEYDELGIRRVTFLKKKSD